MFKRIKIWLAIKIRQAVTILTVGGIAGGVIYAAFFAGQLSSPEHMTAQTVDNLPAKIEKMKIELIEEVSKKEAPNFKDSDALVVYDNNSKGTLSAKNIPSFGCMQYKVSTVQLHYKTLYSKDLSNYEATLLALDCVKAKSLAKDAIFKIQGAIWNWSVATKEMGDKVAFIRQLEK